MTPIEIVKGLASLLIQNVTTWLAVLIKEHTMGKIMNPPYPMGKPIRTSATQGGQWITTDEFPLTLGFLTAMNLPKC